MFIFSKLLSAITQPMFWLGLCWLLALVLRRRWPRGAVRLQWFGLMALVLLGFQAIPDALLRPLEGRFPVPTEAEVAQHAGVIVLGGALGDAETFAAHGQVPLGAAAERMTVPLALLRQHPRMQLVFSGGEGRLWTTGITEAAMAAAFYREQGIDSARVTLEDGARNTHENARLVALALGARCAERWLLVTSAWHMPRAYAEFRKTGCRVTPYPVDYRTGASTSITEYSLAYSLLRWQIALHEWLGLLVYRVFA